MSIKSHSGFWRTVFCESGKCEFHAAFVSFLESIVAEGQVRMDPAKIQAVLDWPYPMAKKNYRGS